MHTCFTCLTKSTLSVLLILALIAMAHAQQPVPYPFDAIVDLAPEQRQQIVSLKENIDEQMKICLENSKRVVSEYNKDRNTPFLIENETLLSERSTKELYLRKFVGQALSLLNENQQRFLLTYLNNKENELSIVNFKGVPQMDDKLCWAACVQMIVNYKGVVATQQQIASLVLGTGINQNATYNQLHEKLNTLGLIPFDDSRNNNWTIQFYKLPFNPARDSTGGGQVVAQIARNSIFIIGFNDHLSLLYKVKYRFGSTPIPEVISVTYYDPLLDKSIDVPWSEAADRIQDWYMCTASDGREKIFSYDPKYDLSKACN